MSLFSEQRVFREKKRPTFAEHFAFSGAFLENIKNPARNPVQDLRL